MKGLLGRYFDFFHGHNDGSHGRWFIDAQYNAARVSRTFELWVGEHHFILDIMRRRPITA